MITNINDTILSQYYKIWPLIGIYFSAMSTANPLKNFVSRIDKASEEKSIVIDTFSTDTQVGFDLPENKRKKPVVMQTISGLLI